MSWCTWGNTQFPLHQCCEESSELAPINSIIQQRPFAMRQVDQRGNTPLHRAAMNQTPGAAEVVRKVMGEYPAQCLQRNVDGATPVHVAVRAARQSRVAEQMLFSTCRPKYTFADDICGMELDGEGRTVLQNACRNTGPQSKAIVFACLASDTAGTCSDRGECGDLPVHIACSDTANLEVIEVLLSYFPMGIDMLDNDQDMCLHRAVVNANGAGPAIVDHILSLRPNVIAKPGSQGELPLHKACAASPHFSVVCKLIELYPEAVTMPALGGVCKGDLPAHRAACSNQECAIDILATVLAKYPRATETPGFLGRLPIHIVCSEAKSVVSLEEVFSWSMDENLGLLKQDDENDTPLHRAMYNSDVAAQRDIVTLILSSCSQAVSRRGSGDALPLHMACKYSTVEIASLLLRHFVPDEADCKRTIKVATERYGSGGGALWALLDDVQVTKPRGACTLGNLTYLDSMLDRHAGQR